MHGTCAICIDEAPGLLPRTLTKRLGFLDLGQGQWPLDPFILVGEWERADTNLDTSQLALSHSATNGQIAKGLARRLPSRLSRGLEVQKAKPPGGFKGDALVHGAIALI
jgi:hypothetical protein